MNPYANANAVTTLKSRRQTDPFAPVADDLSEVENLLRNALESDASLILEVSRYMLEGGGKRFRPALHLLCSKLVGLDNPIKYRMAAALECLHTATLLHDDIVDNADLRRGQPAAHVVFGDHTAVLVGDFLYTTAVKWILETGDMELTRTVADVCSGMAEGEAYQLDIARTRRLNEDDYLHVVNLKTAGLISLCCYSAARLAGVDGKVHESLKDFGHKLGMAFQIVDDALDYSSETEQLGKAIGKDLEEGKITLPMFYALNEANSEDRAALERILSSKPIDPDDLPFAQQIIHSYDGTGYALKRAAAMVEEAVSRLERHFDSSPELDALLSLAEFTVSRSK